MICEFVLLIINVILAVQAKQIMPLPTKLKNMKEPKVKVSTAKYLRDKRTTI